MTDVNTTASFTPKSVDLAASTAETFSEKKKVDLQGAGTFHKIDVYFITDSTGSMGDVIGNVKSNVNDICKKLEAKAAEVSADVNYGVGNYRDLDFAQDRWFQHQTKLTADVDVVAEAIGAWDTAGGRDTAEGQLWALDALAEAPGGEIGWRPDSKRIILWLGDAPGHDPICRDKSGGKYDITEDSVLTKLQREGIVVLAISQVGAPDSSSPGLDADPNDHSSGGDFESTCGLRGQAGQASRITRATGGEFANDIDAEYTAEKIIELGGAHITRIDNVKLVPDGTLRLFRPVINPEGGSGPYDGTRKYEVEFDVSVPFMSKSGKPAKTSPVTVHTGVDVVADGVTVGTQKIDITVPDLSGTYKIQSACSGKILQVNDPGWESGQGKNQGGNINQGSDRNERNQQWELEPVPGGGYRLKNADPAIGKYLEVAGESTDNGAEILTRNDANGQHKEWQLVPVGSDEKGVLYKIMNMKTRKVMDLKDGSTQEKGTIYQYTYWGNYGTSPQENRQHWRLLPV